MFRIGLVLDVFRVRVRLIDSTKSSVYRFCRSRSVLI